MQRNGQTHFRSPFQQWGQGEVDGPHVAPWIHYAGCMRIVITGANRGIGLEFSRQFAARGEVVDATARHPESADALRTLAAEAAGRVRIHRCDVGDDHSVHELVQSLAPGKVDLLINNAGIYGRMQSLEELDLQDVIHTFSVDALGAIRVTRALLPNLREGGGGKIAHITSKMGSVADNTSGGAYGYRMAKAALNMASKSMAVDLRADRIVSVVFNPGWVQTDMGGARAPTPVDQSVANMIRIIDRLRLEDSGRFFNHTGEEVPF